MSPVVGRRTLLWGASGLLLGAAACSGDEPEAPEDDGGAAEPATSPELTRAPAGSVVEVGPGPQGIVYDARTRTVLVAVREPYRLLMLDPLALSERRSVQLPGKVRHLQVTPAGGVVLVGAETADQLLEVPVLAGDPIVTDVEHHPHDAAGARNGEVVVGNEFSGSISFVRDGRVLQTVSDLRQPGGVVVVGDTVAVVDVGDYTLSTYDLATRRRTGRIAAGAGPTHLVALSGRRVAVVDTRGGQVLLFRLDPLRLTGRLALSGSPYGVTADPGGLLWVTLTATNGLVGLDVSGAAPRIAVPSLPTVRQPDTVAVAPDSRTVWVTGTAEGVVQRVAARSAARPGAGVSSPSTT